MKAKLKKLFGFRSWTPWKMILAVIYYALVLLVFVSCLTSRPPVPMDGYDTAIYLTSSLIITLGLLTPAIFLSDTPIRDKTPLFKLRIGGYSLVGLMIAFVFFVYLFATVENLHSEPYKEAYESYISSFYQGMPVD